MTEAVAILLKRNLREVFAERDADRRRAAIAELFAPDCVFSSPHGRHVGPDALDRAIAELQARLPDHVFSELGAVQTLQDAGRLAWAFGPPADPSRITGLDLIVLRDDRIGALYTFLDPSPP